MPEVFARCYPGNTEFQFFIFFLTKPQNRYNDNTMKIMRKLPVLITKYIISKTVTISMFLCFNIAFNKIPTYNVV